MSYSVLALISSILKDRLFQDSVSCHKPIPCAGFDLFDLFGLSVLAFRSIPSAGFDLFDLFALFALFFLTAAGPWQQHQPPGISYCLILSYSVLVSLNPSWDVN
jgi:hypothetical protein